MEARKRVPPTSTRKVAKSTVQYTRKAPEHAVWHPARLASLLFSMAEPDSEEMEEARLRKEKRAVAALRDGGNEAAALILERKIIKRAAEAAVSQSDAMREATATPAPK